MICHMLKIALIGYGKMGKMIEQMAVMRDHEIVAIIDPEKENREITLDALSAADVCIEFTRPDAVLDNIRKTLRLGKNIVVGTTGWSDSLESVERWVTESGAGLFYASNFSLGINLFLKTVEHAADLFLKRANYQAAGVEIHHKQKLDSPSGTAIAIQDAIARASGNTPIFSSVRCGSTPGTHTVYFDSPADTITLTHQARNREGFALGAITAAEWMLGRKGIYTMEDMLCLS